jgi:ABC-type branched-subunit amino acid transport system ATPase component
MSALATEGVSVSFGGVRALQDVSIAVEPGQILGLIGANGAGKTTLFDAISGIVPSQGRVLLGERDISRDAVHERARAGLGRSFQDARLFHSMSVLDTLRVSSERRSPLGARVLGTLLGSTAVIEDERAATARALEVVESFGLSAYRDKLVSELSTGTRRVVDLAGLIIQRPSVVLLDEPSSGIAQREAEALGPLLQQIRNDLGCAMVVIEHDMPLLLGIADRLVCLETGRVIAEGSPDDVVADPAVVRSYLGGDGVAVRRSGTH